MRPIDKVSSPAASGWPTRTSYAGRTIGAESFGLGYGAAGPGGGYGVGGYGGGYLDGGGGTTPKKQVLHSFEWEDHAIGGVTASPPQQR